MRTSLGIESSYHLYQWRQRVRGGGVCRTTPYVIFFKKPPQDMWSTVALHSLNQHSTLAPRHFGYLLKRSRALCNVDAGISLLYI